MQNLVKDSGEEFWHLTAEIYPWTFVYLVLDIEASSLDIHVFHGVYPQSLRL